MPDELLSIDVYYEKSAAFRVVHVDGAYGGLSPSGGRDSAPSIHMTMYSERRPLPKQQTMTFVQGDPEPKVTSHEANKSGIFRELETCAVMNLDTAKALYRWIGEKIQEAERVWETIKDERADDDGH